MNKSIAKIAICCALLIAGMGSSSNGSPSLFSNNDRLLIARAVAENHSSIRLIFAVEPSVTTVVAQNIRQLDGRVYYEADDLGYIRADVPLDRIASLEGISGVDFINVSPPNQFDVELQNAAARRIDQKTVPSNIPDGLPTPSASTRNTNDFTGVGEVGAAQFIAAHPTYDGRGVRIAFFEPVPPDLPYLQKATDMQGNGIPKLIEHRFTTNIAELTTRDKFDNGWISMNAVVHAYKGAFIRNGKRYVVPHDGDYRFGIFALGKTSDGRYGMYSNTLHHPHGTSYGGVLDYAVLWDESSNFVWVDTQQNGNFAKQPALTDYAVGHRYGILHLHNDSYARYGFVVFDKPEEAPDAYPFVVQTNSDAKAIGIFLSSSTHAAMVASSAAGVGFFGGSANGMAPGAQVLSFDQAEDYPYFLESMITAARDHADILSLQFGVTFLFDNGQDVFDTIARRLVDRFNVVITSAAGNSGPTMTTVDSPSVASGIFAVGGYLRGARSLMLRGAAVSKEEYVVGYSSRGPSGSGQLKPDFLAPTEWLAGTSLQAPPGILRDRMMLPPGYDIGGGTSQAGPSGAGAIALLISAAKQAHIAYTPASLALAIAQGAHVLPGYQGYEQGAGLINVPGAWRALQKLAEQPTIVGDAPVRTVTSPTLTTPNRGVGIYEREGWRAGVHGRRTIGLTRTNGDPSSQTFDVRWVQNDGTFRSTNSVTLGLNQRTEVSVDIQPVTSGVHSAFLELVDPRSGVTVYRQLNTIVAAEQLTPANNFTVSHKGVLEHLGVMHYFIHVPPHTGILSIAMTTASADTRDFFRIWTGELVDVHMPDGRNPALEALELPYHDGNHYARAYPQPMPGVWEIAINNATPGLRYAEVARKPLPPTHYAFSASVIGIRMLKSQKIRENTYRVELLNTEAPMHPLTATKPLGTMQRSTISLSASRPQAFISIHVPAKATEIRVEVTPVIPTSADAHIYLFNCAKNVPARQVSWVYQGPCELKATGQLSQGGIVTTALPAGGGEGQLWRLEPTPVPGRWVAVVAALKLQNPLLLRVTRIIMSSNFGTVTTSSPHLLVSSGQKWLATMSVRPSIASQAHSRNVSPVITTEEGETISEKLPLVERGSVLLNAKPIVTHTQTPIDIQPYEVHTCELCNGN